MGRPKKVKEIENVEEVTDDSTTMNSGTTSNPQPEVILKQESTWAGDPTQMPRLTFHYPVPETKEDLLALHKCLKDMGVNSIGDIEVRASRA